MISRRDKLLVRPWEQRRYEYHRRKVQSAIPVIDVGPPANRVHVSYKLKKQQKETERCHKIEKDNLKLLQRLRNVMTSSRVDNTWSTAQPNFLNKVAIYDANNKLMYKRKGSPAVSFDEDRTRKGRCVACTPKKMISPLVPEDRIPWEPLKSPVSHIRSKSVPPRRVKISEPSKDTPSRKNSSISSSNNTISSIPPKLQPRLQSRSNLQLQTLSKTPVHSITLSRNNMHLDVSFPQDTMVEFKNGKKSILTDARELCNCKAFRSEFI